MTGDFRMMNKDIMLLKLPDPDFTDEVAYVREPEFKEAIIKAITESDFIKRKFKDNEIESVADYIPVSTECIELKDRKIKHIKVTVSFIISHNETNK